MKKEIKALDFDKDLKIVDFVETIRSILEEDCKKMGIDPPKKCVKITCSFLDEEENMLMSHGLEMKGLEEFNEEPKGPTATISGKNENGEFKATIALPEEPEE